MEIIKTVMYLIATAVMGATIWICPAIADDVCIFFVSLLSTYLGLDVWSMIKSTSLMPPGEYSDIKVHRYVVCAVSYVILIIFGYIQSARTGIDFNSMFTVLISAIFVLITILIGGLEGNKLATGEKKEQ